MCMVRPPPSCVCSSFNQSLCDVYGATTSPLVCVAASTRVMCMVRSPPLLCVAASTRARVLCMVRSPPLLCVAASTRARVLCMVRSPPLLCMQLPILAIARHNFILVKNKLYDSALEG